MAKKYHIFVIDANAIAAAAAAVNSCCVAIAFFIRPSPIVA